MKTVIRLKRHTPVLVVEDNPERIHWFKKKMVQANVTYALTPAKAENVLGAHRFDVVFLDHDAVPEFVERSDPNYLNKTFYNVATMLERQKWGGTVIIHSHNPVGARRMEHALARHAHVQIIPFGMFDIEEYS